MKIRNLEEEDDHKQNTTISAWSLQIILKIKWFGHMLRGNCLLRDATDGQMTEIKGARRRTQLLDDLRKRRRYWKLNEEAED